MNCVQNDSQTKHSTIYVSLNASIGFCSTGCKALAFETCVSKTGLLRIIKVQFMHSPEPLFLIITPPTPSQIQTRCTHTGAHGQSKSCTVTPQILTWLLNFLENLQKSGLQYVKRRKKRAHSSFGSEEIFNDLEPE